jgi:class 3 adenylate cyclase
MEYAVDIAAWLSRLGLERYQEAFRANEINAEILPKLTADDLKDIGVTIVGHRRKLLEAIAALTEPDSARRAELSTPARARGAEAERRQLTVMFADLVGSTALSAKLDPEDMRAVIGGYQNAVAGEATRFEGYVAKFMGDGVLAYFGWPRAHEDDAERAVRAGLAITRAVARLEGSGTRLECRVGIATGLVVVGDLVGDEEARERAVVGETPNLAARLQTLAMPGQVVIAEATSRLVGSSFDLSDLGPQHLKGLSAPAPAFAVLGERELESRFEARSGPAPTKMVGRDQELALVLERWSLAAAGEGQGVLLAGEAGIGKSRVAQALLDALADQPHTRVRYQCSPYHTDSALWPVVQQLGHAAGFTAADSTGARLDALEALLAKGSDEPTGTVPLIADLLGLEGRARYGTLNLAPQAQRAQTLEALVQQLLGLACRQPVLLVLEDAHWIDPTTLELMEQYLDRIADARVLLLLTSRPDHQPALAVHPRVTRLTLNRLGRADVQTIVTELGGEALSVDVIDAIIDRTDGVPLFVEELTKAVLEAGEASIPASLHDSLMARLDRIPEVKQVAQIAACIGREFSHDLLAAIADQPDTDLRVALERLVSAELILRRGAPSDARYMFKHALVQDTAYESLLKARRREVHGRITDALAAAGDPSPEVIALHAERAGRIRASAALWLQAGRRAYGRSAVHEAVAHLRSALRQLAELPGGAERDALKLEARLALAQGLLAARSWADHEAGEQFAAAGELARRVGNPEQRTAGLFGAYQYRQNRQEFDLARPLAEEMLSVAEAADDHAARIVGHRSLGALAYFTGQSAIADLHLRRAIELHDPTHHGDLAARYGFELRSGAMAPLAMSLVSRGQVHEGLAMAEEALAYADRLPLRHAWCHTAVLTSHALHFARLDARLREVAERCMSIAAEQGFAYLRARSEIMVGLARVHAGRVSEGLDLLRCGMTAVTATGTRLGQSYDHAILAEALLAAGQPASAGEAASEAAAVAYGSGEHFFTPALLTLAALAACAQGKLELAERDLKRAVAEAREREMRLFELRAATSLARLWAEQGQRQKAHDLLAPIYGWFTESFDMPDLNDARAFLDELA